jgi:hypothetical protein
MTCAALLNLICIKHHCFNKETLRQWLDGNIREGKCDMPVLKIN